VRKSADWKCRKKRFVVQGLCLALSRGYAGGGVFWGLGNWRGLR